MKVLGINFSNDAAASLVVDGVVVGDHADEVARRIDDRQGDDDQGEGHGRGH